MDLLDLLADIETAEHGPDPRLSLVHYCLPAMGYVCGGSIVGLPDGGPGGRQQLGGWGNPERWALITCPDCRAPGRREVARIHHRQQLPIDHACTDECPWTAIPDSESEPTS